MATITFRVSLATVNQLSHKQPFHGSSMAGHEGTEGANFQLTRVTWFPDFLRRNHELKHGDEFTVSDMEANYLRDNFTSGEFNFLDIV